MNNKFSLEHEWIDIRLAMNCNNQLIQVREPQEIKKQTLKDFIEEQDGSFTIDNQKDHDFQNELKKMTDFHCSYNLQRIQNYKDKKDNSITQISESYNQSNILPQQIKQNKQQIQTFGDKKLFLNVKGEGFQEFKLRSIKFKLQCPSCQIFLPTKNYNKLNSNILEFQADCKKCLQQMNIHFQKHIEQLSENPSQWFLGQIKTSNNVEFQLNSIEVTAICKCLSQSSRLPYLLVSFEQKEKIISQNQRLKCLLTDQSRQLCHGCVQELKFQPAWLIIKS
ncbi:unnamed protein product [Paramecium sonneborni]|uniref:Uncharacterized protein n=1 Tax=Paramecium sonneborni TaxID=65129 RepID=A0A8S1K8W5_9CILI|nr:unnamed protein product [Paramecium sonneborni]